MTNSAKDMRKIIESINTNQLEEMDTLTIYPDGYPDATQEEPETIPVKNGMVSRMVSAVGDRNIPDAIWLAKILNSLSDDAFRH